TSAYGRLKEARADIARVERAVDEVKAVLAEQNGLIAREKALKEELEGLRAKKGDLEEQILEREGEPGYLALLEAEKELEALEREERELADFFRITASAAASLLKKAEHEGGKEEVKKAIRKLRETMEQREVKETERMLPELARWEEVMVGMAGKGRLSPKNRAEREILAGERRLSEEFSGIFKRQRELEEKRREKHAHISASPLRQEMRSDKEQRDSVLGRIAESEEELERVGARIDAMDKALPGRIESLNSQISDLEERPVRVKVQTG
ncbi:MAG: hypothetical protein RQ758_06700, partial [Methanomicrobiaceae archaeon]|nr:hypothetical protein [Methanomicrobiaceae archaeon]